MHGRDGHDGIDSGPVIRAGSDPVAAMVSGATINGACSNNMRGLHEIANPRAQQGSSAGAGAAADAAERSGGAAGTGQTEGIRRAGSDTGTSVCRQGRAPAFQRSRPRKPKQDPCIEYEFERRLPKRCDETGSLLGRIPERQQLGDRALLPYRNQLNTSPLRFVSKPEPIGLRLFYGLLK